MRLFCIIPDYLSAIIDKGEIQPGYYNPGNLADEVHILMTNDDKPPVEPLQYMAGTAQLFLHNLPEDRGFPVSRLSFLTPSRLERWAKPGVELARKIRPDLIRCHGADWNAYLASRIKRELGVPYCVSLHINPDVNAVRRYLPPKSGAERRNNVFYEYLENEGLRFADKILPVYKPILPYLERHKIPSENIQVAYNILNTLHLKTKTDYAAHSPFRLICVGRLFEDKNPGNILYALAHIPNAELTVVGDGPIRPEIEALAHDLNIVNRVHFAPAIPNDDLCRLLPEQDAFVVHTEYFELNKSVLEALLTGLPVIINRRKGVPVPEFEEGDFVRLVENTPEAYRAAILSLMTGNEVRESLGRKAYTHARALWDPQKTEAVYVAVYKDLLGKKNG
jgi:glycosyltransferase involved in cell wall biosynthesis